MKTLDRVIIDADFCRREDFFGLPIAEAKARPRRDTWPVNQFWSRTSAPDMDVVTGRIN